MAEARGKPTGRLGLQSWEATRISEIFKLCIRLRRTTMAIVRARGYTITLMFGSSSGEFIGSNGEIVVPLPDRMPGW